MDELVDIPDDAEVKDYPRYWLPEPVYQVLKWTALVLMPLASVIYTALAGVWYLSKSDEERILYCKKDHWIGYSAAVKLIEIFRR